ncbi:MAG: PQQ-dependent sugar dehydrogenase [Pseudomonadota bacterium]
MRQIILAQAILCLTLSAVADDLPLSNLNLPSGFSIEIFARVENARQMTQGAPGVIYVGSRRAGKVHAVIDKDGDHRADEVRIIASDLLLPSGLTYRNGDLFVAAVSTIYRFRDIDSQLDQPPAPEIVIDTLPDKTHHGWKFIEFGPDGLLYVPVGAPCNICLSEDRRFATILRMNVDQMPVVPEIYVEGVRNTVGFDWAPDTGHLWFTDNGRDLMGDDLPPCELNEVTAAGQHFGYPFFHGTGIPDPEFGKGKKARNYVAPALNLGPHTAPLGMIFYTGSMLPASYRGDAIIAEHGSWNRTPEAGHTGYRLVHARRDEAGQLHYDVFVDGWLNASNQSWGRPVDLLQLNDGSLLVSDDKANVIYRISYTDS